MTPTIENQVNGKDVHASAPSSSLRTALIDSVDVVIESYLGAAPMTVAQLNALAIDDTVTLDQALNAPVELRLNGVSIAQGELVAVGDKFGVRITHLAP